MSARPGRLLERVLFSKLVVTVLLWVVPLLFPVPWMEALGFPPPAPLVFVRLLAVAYAALCVGYLAAWREARSGAFPASTVLVGLVSNGGAFGVLLFGLAADWFDGWGAFAHVYIQASAGATLVITTGLAVAWTGRARFEVERAGR